MESTKSYVTIYNISPEVAEDFEFDYDTAGVGEGCHDILTELVPNLEQWGDLGWMEIEEYEYNPNTQRLHLLLETKWEPPLRWLQQASHNCAYFENKLVTMSTIQKDETYVTGAAIMDGEILQNKTLWQVEPEEIAKYYDDAEKAYDVDDLDSQIWDAIGKFLTVCEQFYLEGGEKND